MKVRDAIKMIQDDGWELVRTRGSHRQYKHQNKNGLVTIADKPSDERAPGTLNSILKTSRIKEMKYLIIIEKTNTGFSAYSPDLEGCVATGETKEEAEKAMHEGIEFHLDGLCQEEFEISEPKSYSKYIEVAA